MAQHHYNITIKGFVQGVSYRFATHTRALQLGLKGYVKNLPNGDVYLEAEGEEQNINKLIDWCASGPPKAEVTEVNVEESEMKNFKTFELKK